MQPDYMTCPVTYCNYLVVSSAQNKNLFIQYCDNSIKQLENGKIINYSLKFHTFLYGLNDECFKIIQIAECFNNSSFKNSNISIDLKNGMILVSPFDKDIKNKLGQLLLHLNTKIITYDFTADISNLMKEEIPFRFESIIDGNISKSTGFKIFELPFSSLTTACKKSKFYRPNKNSKNKQNLHTSNEFNYLLQNTENSIDTLFNDKFWESIVSDCSLVAIAFSNSLSNIGITKLLQFTNEKIKAFQEIQKQYGINGPFLMKKFFNDDNLLHSTDIPSENYAYDVWIATKNALDNFEVYNKIVPSDKRLTKSCIVDLQKKAESKILNIGSDHDTNPNNRSKTTKDDDNKSIATDNPNNNTKNSNSSNNNANSSNNKKSQNFKTNAGSISSWQKISGNIQTKIQNDKKKTGNNRIDSIIYTIENFVKQNSVYLKDLQTNWDDLYPKVFNIQKSLQINDRSFDLIEQSIQNIKNYSKLTSKKISKEKKKLVTNNVNEILIAVNIFLSFMSNQQIKNESKIIEKKLFNVIFNPSSNNDSLITKIFSVYKLHDDFIYTNESVVNFNSSTGSGKTRCAPFFFAIKAIDDNMKRPFIIMTQPGFSIIKDKIKDFNNILGDSVEFVTDIWEMVDLYTNFINKRKNNHLFSKPIVGIFSPQNLLTLIHKLQKRRINVCSITRFCLDEIHERSVESDVLEAILSNSMNDMMQKGKNFPLQLLMMSATPDTRILNCFKKVTRFELPNSQLFPVEQVKVQLENKNQVNEEVVNQTYSVINKMTNREIQNGHILIFASGNSRINDIQAEIFENAEEKCSSGNCVVVVIKNFDLMFKNSDIKQFYANLDDFIHRETNRIQSNYRRKCYILFLLPIKYMGYVSNEQKEIGKNPISKHPNLIKIIMATNAIESSITIDGLAAVIDSGLFNHSSYDKSNGLTSLNEEPISIQSQTQRKGRVGRIRPGISVQITLKDKPLPSLLPPAIKTSDISLNILFLRKIGYRLEDIQNLPDSLDKEEIDKYISELISFNALDKNNHNLTSYGRVLGNFSFVSPFIASAIIKVAGFKPNEIILKNADKIDDKAEIEKQFRLLLGILISLLFGAPDLCINRFSKKLRFYFDKKSDIVTLLRTLLDLAQMKTVDIKANAFYYGLNAQIAVKILGQVQQAAENLFFSSKEMRQINMKDQANAESKGNQEVKKDQTKTESKGNQEVKKDQTKTESKEKQEVKKDQINETKQTSTNNEVKTQNKEQEVTKPNTSINGITIQKSGTNSISVEKCKSAKLLITKLSIQLVDPTPEQKEKAKENPIQKDDNKPPANNHNQYFTRKNIFKYLQQLVDQLMKDNLLHQFIQNLIDEIGKNKPEWINCRRASFANVEYAYDEPSFIYKGDESLSQNDSNSFICIRMRPGSIGLDSPGSAFILSITHELNSRMNYGSLIHCDSSVEEKESIPHPISIETSSKLFNDFSEPLIEAYLNNKLNHFKKFCRERWNRNDEGNCLLFKSQEVIADNNIKYYFSFIPKDENAIELFNKASKAIEPLLPYTPSTVLIKHPNLKCTISIRGVGTDVIDSSVHFFTDDDYHPYQMNRKTIEFLIQNIQYLSCIDESISIGVTGESFCYPLGDSSFKKQNHSKIWYPQSNSNCTSVFSNEPFFYTHLVMISKKRIKEFDEYLLKWDADPKSLDNVEDDLILHAANEIARELITVRKSFNRILITTPSSYIRTKGDAFYYSGNNTSMKSGESNEINNILNGLVKNYIQGDSLIKPIGLSAFYYAVPKCINLPDIGYIPKSKFRKAFGYGCICLDVEDDNATESVSKTALEKLENIDEMNENFFEIVSNAPDLRTKVFNIIDKLEDELKYQILMNTESNDKIIEKLIECNYKQEEIKNHITRKITFVPIFNENKEYTDQIFEIIRRDEILRQLTIKSIDCYKTHYFLPYKDLFRDEKVKQEIIHAYKYDFRNDFRIKFLERIANSENIKNQLIELNCKGDLAKRFLSSEINSNKQIRIEVFDKIKSNEELQTALMKKIHGNGYIKQILMPIIIKNDNGITNKVIQIIEQTKKEKKEKEIESKNSNYDLFLNRSFGLIQQKNKVEKLQVYSVTIKHNVRSSLSKEDFEKKVSSVVSQFGAIVTVQHPYLERFSANGSVKGTITVLMYSSYFTLPLVSMIKEALQESDSYSTLNIPNNIIDKVLLNDQTVSNILKKWFKDNDLNIKQNDLQLVGKEEDVKNALDKLKAEPPEIPFNSYPLQGHINLFQINNHIKHLNRNKETKWYLNRETRTVLIPSNEEETEITKFLSQFNINIIDNQPQNDDKIDRILWDINFHDDEAVLSKYLINIYYQDGKLIQRNFCVDCVYETFLYNLRKMYNEDEDRGIYEEIINDDQLIPPFSFAQCQQVTSSDNNLVQMFPVIPFGQLLWSFINEAKISNQTRTWVTALSLRILKKTPKVTFCPIHPYILFPSPPQGTSMKCVTPNCCFSLCCWCNKWHKTGSCEKTPVIPPGVRQCPFCHEVIEKMEKCNHIRCRCGKDFCYYCGRGFTGGEDTYNHMTSEKHWEEAPDYLKYIKNKVVDPNVLNQFYDKYPHLKPKLAGSKDSENQNDELNKKVTKFEHNVLHPQIRDRPFRIDHNAHNLIYGNQINYKAILRAELLERFPYNHYIFQRLRDMSNTQAQEFVNDHDLFNLWLQYA